MPKPCVSNVKHYLQRFLSEQTLPTCPHCSASICGFKIILWRCSQRCGSTAGMVEGASGQDSKASSDLDFTTMWGNSHPTATSGVSRDGGYTGDGAVGRHCSGIASLRWGGWQGPQSNQSWEKKGRARKKHTLDCLALSPTPGWWHVTMWVRAWESRWIADLDEVENSRASRFAQGDKAPFCEWICWKSPPLSSHSHPTCPYSQRDVARWRWK